MKVVLYTFVLNVRKNEYISVEEKGVFYMFTCTIFHTDVHVMLEFIFCPYMTRVCNIRDKHLLKGDEHHR